MTELNPQASLVPSKEVSPSSALYADAGALGLSLDAWAKALLVGPLFIAVYWLVLRWLWDKTNPFTGEANWGHAVCIPAVGLYYLYINRDDVMKQPVQPLLFSKFTAPHRLWAASAMIVVGGLAYLLSKAGAFVDPSMFIKAGGEALAMFGLLVLLLDWGLASLLFGLGLFAYGIWPGQNQFVQGCGMILTLFGVVLMLTGWRVMQFAWFPIAYLICGIPWPPLVYSYIASPLQTLAAKVGVKTLQFTGVSAWRTGTKINMDGGRTLNVAEACAGLRSLMTFITVGVAVAFLSARPLWQKIIISVSAIPIAIFCNVMRIAGQGLLDHYVPAPYGHQLAEGFAHQFVGLVMLVPAFFMILLVGWMLDHIFVEELDEKEASTGILAAPAAGQLVREIPRKPNVAPVSNSPVTKSAETISKPAAAVAKPATPAAPIAKPVAPVSPPVKPAAPAPVVKPVVPPASKPAPPPTRTPGAPVIPPRPGIVPPRPGASRPASPQSRPPTPPPSNRPPQPPPPQEDQK